MDYAFSTSILMFDLVSSYLTYAISHAVPLAFQFSKLAMLLRANEVIAIVFMLFYTLVGFS